MIICLERGADLHMAQLMPLPLTDSCFSKIQFGFAFLVPAHPGSPGQRAVKWVCVCVCVFLQVARNVVLLPDYCVACAGTPGTCDLLSFKCYDVTCCLDRTLPMLVTFAHCCCSVFRLTS